jgi:hypothetical protein
MTGQLPTSEECGLVTTISGATFGSLTESLPLTDLLKVAIFLVCFVGLYSFCSLSSHPLKVWVFLLTLDK